MRASTARRLSCFARRFLSDDSGAVTVEAVLWIPIFLSLLVMIADASLAFFSRAQAYRIVEIGNRSFATSKPGFDDNLKTAEWIETQFRNQFPRATAANVDTVTAANFATGLVTTTLTYRARDVVLFNSLNVLGGWQMQVVAQQYLERAS